MKTHVPQQSPTQKHSRESDLTDITSEFPASFTFEELDDVAAEENWGLIECTTYPDSDESAWEITCNPSENITVLIHSQTDRSDDELLRNVCIFGDFIHITDYDVYETLIERVSEATNGKLVANLKDNICEKINHTKGEPLSESQFNELFTDTEQSNEFEGTEGAIDSLLVMPDSSRYLHDVTLEDIRIDVAVIEEIHNDHEAKLETNQ